MDIRINLRKRGAPPVARWLVTALAFHEPLEYKPTNRWYRQFDNRSIEAPLRVGGDIHGVVGATLSAHATTRGVRRALAYYEALIQSED